MGPAVLEQGVGSFPIFLSKPLLPAFYSNNTLNCQTPRAFYTPYSSRPVVLTGGDFALRGHLAMSGDILWMPAMLLDTQQCTGWPWMPGCHC